ncbi:hypothetical protein BZA70DRAFT_58819 [Myxozyma melibiosi]|uniref:Uncharacterized protein n=1 Tax=Myxozyma melibiosi TaxID=54550 RepID=A0ABR1F1P1_9ASCO
MDSTAAQHQLFRANAVIQRLRASLQKTKLASSHHHLQSRLLMIETQELTRRQEVEKAILQREVDKLRQDLMSSSRSVTDDAADGPVQQHYSIMADYEANSTADKYRRRLVRAKRRLRDALKMVEEKEDEIDRLKGQPGARGRADQQRQSGSSSHHQSRPRRRGGGRSRDKNEEGALAALGILASQVLSQQQLDESESHEGSTVGSVAGSLPASPVRGADAAGRINAEMIVAPSISEAQRLRMSGHRLPARAPQHQHQQQDNEATDPADTDVETGDGETETEDNNDSSVGNAAAAVAAAVESEVAAGSKKASQSEDSATEPIVDGEDVANITEISEETGLSSTTTTTTTTAKAGPSTTPASSVTQPHFDPDITLDAPSSPPIAASGFQSINLPAKSPSAAAAAAVAAADPRKRRRNSSVSTVSSVSGEYGAEGLRKQKLEVAR